MWWVRIALWTSLWASVGLLVGLAITAIVAPELLERAWRFLAGAAEISKLRDVIEKFGP